MKACQAHIHSKGKMLSTILIAITFAALSMAVTVDCEATEKKILNLFTKKVKVLQKYERSIMTTAGTFNVTSSIDIEGMGKKYSFQSLPVPCDVTLYYLKVKGYSPLAKKINIHKVDPGASSSFDNVGG